MEQAEIPIHLCLKQGVILEKLDQLSAIIEKCYRRLPQNEISYTQRTFQKFLKIQESTLEEFDQWYKIICSSPWVKQSIKPQFEKMSVSLHQTMDGVVKWEELKQEEWKQTLLNLGEKIESLKRDMRGVNLKESFHQFKGAVLLDQYKTLGNVKVIQWVRKVWHCMAALSIVFIYLVLPGPFAIKMTVFGILMSALLIADLVRISSPRVNAAALRIFPKIMRQEEVGKINSATFFAVATFIVCIAFSKPVAILSILFLGFGDVVASIVGIRFGKHKITSKISLEGTLAFFGVSFLISFLYPLLNPNFSGPIVLFAFLAGIIGAASELVSSRVDDNFVIPIFSAIGLTLLSLIWG